MINCNYIKKGGAQMPATTQNEIWSPQVIAAFISVGGVLLSSIFGYISSYYGNQQSQKNELRKIEKNQQKYIEQQNKLEKDKSLRSALQKLTYLFYQTDFDSQVFHTYFNTPEGLDSFNDVMSYVTAYGNQLSTQTAIYLQKAMFESNLLSKHYVTLEILASDALNYQIDWTRYETNAIACLLIAQIRYDISKELINPKDLLAAKYNNVNPNLKRFFETGVDHFIDILSLNHFTQYKQTKDDFQ